LSTNVGRRPTESFVVDQDGLHAGPPDVTVGGRQTNTGGDLGARRQRQITAASVVPRAVFVRLIYRSAWIDGASFDDGVRSNVQWLT
jgi:hypothetical protein